MKYDLKKNKYKFFVLSGRWIAGGFEYREDAADLAKELKSEGQIAKVLTRAGVLRLGIDPGDNANWHRTNPRRHKKNPRRSSTDYHATTTVSGVKTEEAWFEDPLFGTQSVAEMAIDMSRRAPKGAKIVIRGTGKTWTFEVVSPGSVKRAVKKNPRRRNPVTDVLRESGQGWRLRRNPGSCQEDPHSFWFGTPVLVRGMPGLFVRHGKGENEGKVEITIDGVKRWVNSGIVTHPTGPFGSNFVMKLNGRQKNPRRRNPKRSNPRYLTREEFDKRYWPKTKETPEGAAGVPYSVRKEFYADYRNSGLGFAAYKRSTTESFRDY